MNPSPQLQFSDTRLPALVPPVDMASAPVRPIKTATVVYNYMLVWKIFVDKRRMLTASHSANGSFM